MVVFIKVFVHTVKSVPAKRFLQYVFVVALLLRVTFIVWDPSGRKSELHEHGEIAHHIITGHGFAMHWPYDSFDSSRQAIMRIAPTHEGAFLPPLNPYLLACFYEVFGENQTALTAYILLICLLSAIIPIILYLLTKEFASETIARLAAILGACNIFAAFSASTYSGSTIYQLLAPICIYSLVVAYKTKKMRVFVIAGFLSGIMTLIRSEFFLLGPILILATTFCLTGRRSTKFKLVMIAIVAHTTAIAPWTIRNYHLFDKFVPVLSHPWYEVWRGNNAKANGTIAEYSGRTIWVDTIYHSRIVREMDALPYDKQFEVAADNIFQEEVMAFWKDDPLNAIGLGVKKLGMFASSDFHARTIVSILHATQSLLFFGLSLVGMVYLFRKRGDRLLKFVSILFALFFSYYLSLTFFTVMLPRYQIYVLNTMIPVISTGLLAALANKRGDLINV